jgi:protocatechuate 3,4-dioxygenase beta subunit
MNGRRGAVLTDTDEGTTIFRTTHPLYVPAPSMSLIGECLDGFQD